MHEDGNNTAVEVGAVTPPPETATQPAEAKAQDTAATVTANENKGISTDDISKLIDEKLTTLQVGNAKQEAEKEENANKEAGNGQPAENGDIDLAEENRRLKAELATKDLKENALARLEKEELPTGLAPLLDYSSFEAMEKSVGAVKTVFLAECEKMVNNTLRSTTPGGLGTSSNEKAVLTEQIRNGIRGE